MIFGIGSDIVAVARMADGRRRWGERFVARLLTPRERESFCRAARPDHFLAKRFAAKEALGKALGTGLRAPLLLSTISVINDALGKPAFCLEASAQHLLDAGKLVLHLSLSDEQDYALAFVVVERP